MLEATLILVESTGIELSTDRNARLVDEHLIEDRLSPGGLEHNEAAEAVAEHRTESVAAVTAARSAHSSSRL